MVSKPYHGRPAASSPCRLSVEFQVPWWLGTAKMAVVRAYETASNAWFRFIDAALFAVNNSTHGQIPAATDTSLS